MSLTFSSQLTTTPDRFRDAATSVPNMRSGRDVAPRRRLSICNFHFRRERALLRTGTVALQGSRLRLPVRYANVPVARKSISALAAADLVMPVDDGCQSSSGVEQRTHKPLVGGSNPSSGTTPIKTNRIKASVHVSTLHKSSKMRVKNLTVPKLCQFFLRPTHCHGFPLPVHRPHSVARLDDDSSALAGGRNRLTPRSRTRTMRHPELRNSIAL